MQESKFLLATDGLYYRIMDGVLDNSVGYPLPPTDSPLKMYDINTVVSNGSKTTFYKGSEGYVYPNQLELAESVHGKLYDEGYSYVHITAEPQSGKTGVVTALTRLISHYKSVDARRVFIITGMGDKDWVAQTSRRLDDPFKDNVYHRQVISKIPIDGREALIIWDECHFASDKKNTPYKILGESLKLDIMSNSNIKLVTISATSPAEVKQIEDMRFGGEKEVWTTFMPSGEDYHGILSLYREGRIRQTEKLTEEWLSELVEEHILDEKGIYHSSPRYHIIRASPRRMDRAIIESFVERNKDIEISSWTHESSLGRGDINEELLGKRPDKHTFIVIYEYFRASKTLDDRYCGMLIERNSDKIDTVWQGLPGRACGRNRSKDTIIYTNLSEVKKIVQMMNGEEGIKWIGPEVPSYKATLIKVSGGSANVGNHFTGGMTTKIKVEKKKHDIVYKYFKFPEEERDMKEYFATLRKVEYFKNCHPSVKKWLGEEKKDDRGLIRVNGTRPYSMSEVDKVKFNDKNKIRLIPLYENLNNTESLHFAVGIERAQSTSKGKEENKEENNEPGNEKKNDEESIKEIDTDKLRNSDGRKGYKLDELKEFCRQYYLPVSGAKAVLRDKILRHLEHP